MATPRRGAAATVHASRRGARQAKRWNIAGDAWINDAIERSVDIVKDGGLDITIVCYGSVDPDVQDLVDRFDRVQR